MFCETISSELLGIPRQEECQLVDESFKLRVNSKNPEHSYLNIHLKMYARNESTEIFRDFSGKTINDSYCGWSDIVQYDTYDANEKYCVSVDQRKQLFQVKCNNTIDLVGMICRPCRPNKRSTESTWMTYTSVPQRSTSVSFILFSICIMIIFALVIALVYSNLRRRRARVRANEFPLVRLRLPPTDDHYCLSGSYEDYRKFVQPQPDTGDSMPQLPPSPPSPLPTSLPHGTEAAGYMPDPNSADPDEFADAERAANEAASPPAGSALTPVRPCRRRATLRRSRTCRRECCGHRH